MKNDEYNRLSIFFKLIDIIKTVNMKRSVFREYRHPGSTWISDKRIEYSRMFYVR
jgi:hypothetical protein